MFLNVSALARVRIIVFHASGSHSNLFRETGGFFYLRFGKTSVKNHWIAPLLTFLWKLLSGRLLTLLFILIVVDCRESYTGWFVQKLCDTDFSLRFVLRTKVPGFSWLHFATKSRQCMSIENSASNWTLPTTAMTSRNVLELAAYLHCWFAPPIRFENVLLVV